MLDRFIKTEERALENPNVPVSADNFLQIMGQVDFSSATGITVNADTGSINSKLEKGLHR